MNWEMAVLIAALLLPYGYIIVRVMARAWFRAKLEYQRNIMDHISDGRS